VPRLALVGNLSFDLVDGGPPRIGGAPIHCGRALRMLETQATLVARCAAVDRARFQHGFARLGLPATVHADDEATTTFAFTYEGDRRIMRVMSIGESWTTTDVTPVPPGGWVHLGALLRGDFPQPVVEMLAQGRRLSLDGQGLTRVREIGPLRLEPGPELESLRYVSILKLAVEEAEALGGLEANALAALGPPEVLVTFGSDGSLVIANGRATEIRARHVDADPTGSGDAFAAAYVVARAQGHRAVSAARRATALVSEMLRARLQ
jgi:sugar/nucleoside kinase (ribokinase family)